MSEPKKKNNRFCPIARKCGACQLQNMSYPEQLSWKMAKSIKLLSRFGHVDEIIGMDEPYHYRNKAQAAFGRTARGKIISGIYQSGTHIIATTDSCYLESPEADAIIVTIRRLAESVGLPIYDEDRRVGCLRHVLVRTGAESGQILVAIVTATPVFPGKNHFIQALLAAHPQITTIVQNINSGHDSMVLGKTQKVLYGSGYIEDTLCGCVFRISARSFYQINHAQTEKLYDIALHYAELSPKDLLIDAYCGIGTIGLIAAKQYGCRVVGIENNETAIRDAVINKKRNGVEQVRFLCDDAGRFLKAAAKENQRADVLICDPPRAGCSRDFLSACVALAPQRMVYISCNPETQARDLGFLTKNGYRVRKIQPVDMFPHTAHIETIVLLSYKKEWGCR